jgi:tetratricopeptide (TPR) repeat protein
LTTYPAAAQNGLGEAALSEGRFEEAVQYFEAALERVPRASRIHYSLAMAYRGLGRLEDAQSHLRQVGQAGIQVADPIVDHLQSLLRGERAHLIQGQLAYQAGQFKAAVEAFGEAVDAAPTSARASVNLGLALAALGDTERAIQQLRAALRLDAENVTAHFTLGTLLAHQGRHADAVEHFRVVINHTPDNVEANRAITRALLKLGRDEEAIASLLRITSLDQGDEESLLTLSTLLTERHRYDEARDLLDRTNRLFPDRSRTTAALARLDHVR